MTLKDLKEEIKPMEGDDLIEINRVRECLDQNIKKCKVCGDQTKLLHTIDISTSMMHDHRKENICCLCTRRIERWLDGGTMYYGKKR